MTGSALRTFAAVTNDWSQADHDRAAVLHGMVDAITAPGPEVRWWEASINSSALAAAHAETLAEQRAERALHREQEA